MKPKKKKAVSVQEIMNNPVDAGQRALHVRREGFWGWLSYVGYMCMVVPMTFAAYFNAHVFSSFYENKDILLGICCVGLLLSMLIIWKSRYPFSKRDRGLILIQFAMFVIGVFLTNFLVYRYKWEYSVEKIVVHVLWVYLLGWYLRYFYCKAKDGYRYVWLKVFLFTVVPFVPLVWWAAEEVRHVVRDDTVIIEGGLEMGSIIPD